MPSPPSPFSSVPQFLQQGAMPPTPGLPPGIQGPGGGGSPMMSPAAGMGMAPPGAAGGPDQDILARVVQMMLTMPGGRDMLAGLGLSVALEKAGKSAVKPHRSNAELSGQGQPVGGSGQVGMASPDQMIRQMGPQGPVPGGAM